jgi:hypothetical protein
MDTARALTICPGDFAPLFGGDLGDAFILVTTPATRELLVLEPDAAVATEELVWTEARGVDDLRDRLREHRRAGHRSSVLWIVEDEFIHLGPHELRSARLGAISFFSGSLSSENLASCLDVVRRTDYQRDLRIESALLAALDSADDVRFRSDDGHAEAIFRHVDCEHWFSLEGPLADGQQTVLPTGELSTLTDPSGRYSFDHRFDLNGTVLLRGAPVVHRGSRAVSVDDTERLFAELSGMTIAGAIATIRDGLVTSVASASPAGDEFVARLDRLFAEDERYRKVHEIGFGTNPVCAELRAGNFFPNERHPSLHLGLGLGGHTDYHIDLVLSEMDVKFEGGSAAGRDLREIVRTSASPSSLSAG